MDQRWLLRLLAAAVVAASGCASGDGAPEARVLNQFSGDCIVEANFLGYDFTTPIGASGSMASREVVEGSGKGYAITMPVPSADMNGDKRVDCYDTALLPGGTLWVTNKTYTAKAGQRTDVVFSAAEATQVAPDCGEVTFREGLKRFARLASYCQ